MSPPSKVRIVEVGPRDGLQNEPKVIPTEAKIAFVDALSKAGYDEIEVSAFVSPKAIPQLADAVEVFAGIRRAPGVTYAALVPNEKGLDRAEGAGADKVAVFTAATETFNRRNIHATIAESLDRFRPVLARAKIPVRGYVSTAFHCPYEGKVDPDVAAGVCRRLVDLGVSEISVGDTIGRATADDVRALLDRLLPCPVPVALHLHDTHGHAAENALVAWREYGIGIFDASAGGLGGCPYAPGAPGNVATERLVEAFTGAGAETGIDPTAVRAAVEGSSLQNSAWFRSG